MKKISKLTFGPKAKLLDKKVIESIIKRGNQIADFLNSLEICPDCGGLINSKTNYPCGESRTYSWSMECKNCYQITDFNIPFGVEINAYVKSCPVICPECGCSMKFGKEYD